MKYQVNILPSALKRLENLPKTYISKIYNSIWLLKDDPRPSGCKKLKNYNNLWRIRIGMYRIIYTIDDEIKVVEVRKIVHRKDAY